MFPRNGVGRKDVFLGISWPQCNLSSVVGVEETNLDEFGAKLGLTMPQSARAVSEQCEEAQPPFLPAPLAETSPGKSYVPFLMMQQNQKYPSYGRHTSRIPFVQRCQGNLQSQAYLGLPPLVH